MRVPVEARRGMTARAPVVAVAMSGGVDSSVAAALCVEAGYDVFGIMLRLWAEPGGRRANACCTLEAVDDAQAVAASLDIPFSVLDAASVFERDVVERFVADSIAGDTPNPCLRCNRHIRFGYLLDRARALGADYVATGHYARLAQDTRGRHALLRGSDRSRDQSYVLHVLDQVQLGSAMFPVGGMQKPDVRDKARALGLPVAERSESTDLCWVGDDGVAGFLQRRFASMEWPDTGDLPASPGPIVDRSGRVLGKHRGLPLYTLGQRRGLGVATGEALYVVERDAARNALVVGSVGALYADHVPVRSVHWIAGEAPDLPVRIEAQIRYKAVPAAAQVVDSMGGLSVVFDEPQRAPTPGQAIVLYRDEVCLGGGLIGAASEERA